MLPKRLEESHSQWWRWSCWLVVKSNFLISAPGIKVCVKIFLICLIDNCREIFGNISRHDRFSAYPLSSLLYVVHKFCYLIKIRLALYRVSFKWDITNEFIDIIDMKLRNFIISVSWLGNYCSKTSSQYVMLVRDPTNPSPTPSTLPPTALHPPSLPPSLPR